MPTISRFFGIIISMYFDDHLPMHFHAEYQEYKAQIVIETGDVVAGKLPRQALRLVEEWRQLHVEELKVAWNYAKNYRNPPKIAPLED